MLVSSNGVLLSDRPIPTTYIHFIHQRPYHSISKQLIYHGALVNKPITGYVGHGFISGAVFNLMGEERSTNLSRVHSEGV